MEDAEKPDRRQRKLRGCALLVLLVFLLPFLVFKACRWSDAHPSDSAMIEEFQRNRAAFAELRTMVTQERRVTRVAEDFIWIDGIGDVSAADRPNYLPDKRLALYRSLFEKLNLESGVIRYEDGSVGFLRSSSGMITSGSSKEFVWSPRMNATLLPSTDRRSLEDACVSKPGCSSTRQIAPEWFITFERN